MNEFWNALLAGLSVGENDKWDWLALPAILFIIVVLSLVF